MYGLHIDHHLISIARDGELLVSAPIAVEFGVPEATVGQHALGVSRRRPTEIALHHWRELAIPGHDDAARRVALEVHGHLRALGLAGSRIEAVVATPADLGTAALTQLRGALSAAGVDVRRFVDSATLTSAAVADRGHYIVLEAGWRSAIATRVAGGADCRLEESFVSENASLLNTYDLWLGAVAAAIVKQTRFDPLGTAATEERLFGELPTIAARAATEGRVEVAAESDGERFAAPIEAPLFADAAQLFYRELTRLARAARIADQSAALVLSAESRRWPGFLARVLELEQDGIVIVPAGLTAVAASMLAAEPDAQPKLERRAARLEGHPLAGSVEYVSSSAASPGVRLPVTHILYNGDSMRFPEPGLVIGTGETPGSPHLTVQLPAPGVSRRHCSLRREGNQTVLVDHSRYGTWVNGARVRERARVSPGDRIRVGTPGVELTLISAGGFRA
jgi:hypothetical protein